MYENSVKRTFFIRWLLSNEACYTNETDMDKIPNVCPFQQYIYYAHHFKSFKIVVDSKQVKKPVDDFGFRTFFKKS